MFLVKVVYLVFWLRIFIIIEIIICSLLKVKVLINSKLLGEFNIIFKLLINVSKLKVKSSILGSVIISLFLPLLF